MLKAVDDRSDDHRSGTPAERSIDLIGALAHELG